MNSDVSLKLHKVLTAGVAGVAFLCLIVMIIDAVKIYNTDNYLSGAIHNSKYFLREHVIWHNHLTLFTITAVLIVVAILSWVFQTLSTKQVLTETELE